MARPSDREFSLQRKIRELENKNTLLEVELKNLKKQIDKNASPEEDTKSSKKKKTIDSPCPDCGAATKTITIPTGLLDVCTKVCGWRRVR